MKQPTIKTKKFILRPLQKLDAASLFKYANNKNIARFLAGAFPNPYTLNDAKKFIKINEQESLKENPRFFTFGIEVNKKIIGTIGIYFSKINFSAEIGFWLGEKYWGKKIMTNVIKKIIKYCFTELKIQRIEAKFLTANIVSKKILEKNKFKFEGILRKSLFKNNKFYDLILMARVR